MWKEGSEAIRTVIELGVERRSRPKKKWLNGIECDMGDGVKRRLRTGPE